MAGIFTCGFECGVDFADGTASAAHFATLTGAPTLNYTTTKRSGAAALRCNAAAAIVTAQCVISAANELRHVGRFYIYFATSLPNGDTPLHSIGNSNTPAGPCLRFKSSDSKLYAGVGATLGATGVTVTTNTWYRIDFHYLISAAGNDTADVQVDGVALGQATAAGAGAGDPREIFGVHSAVTADVLYDDVIISITSGDYPFGGGYVNHFVPTSDGTHTATTTTIVKGTIATPVGGNVAGSTDVFNWVNRVPVLGGATDSTRLVNQQTAGATLYAEVIFGPAPGISTPTTAPRFVDVITADREASTATCNFITKLNDNGTESNIVNRGTVAGVTSDRYARAGFATAPTGGAWTVVSGAGNFNNLRARFGYSSDATPDVYWRGIMVEAEFAEVVATFNPQQRTQTIILQAKKRASFY